MQAEQPIDRWRRQVRAMRDQGLTPQEIAVAMECDEELVATQLKVWAEEEGDGK